MKLNLMKQNLKIATNNNVPIKNYIGNRYQIYPKNPDPSLE